MSLRIRVLLLVALVAVGTAVVSAWLTFGQITRQYARSVTADQTQTGLINRTLREYGYRHATWEGVAGVVRDLSRRTGQRIRLSNVYGEVIVDSDTEDKRTARPAGPQRMLIDPRPALLLTGRERSPEQDTLAAIRAYRRGALTAACLTRHQWPVTVSTGVHGLPVYVPDPALGTPPTPVQMSCQAALSDEHSRDEKHVAADLANCRAVIECLQYSFIDEISLDDVAPVPLMMQLGVADEPESPFTFVPIGLVVIGVAGLALAGSLLVSRRVLRPVATLTSAAERLGEGDLTERVTVTGGDEVAKLARSFNRMADSLQRGEEQQRRLVADVAHELRTPLANLRGYLEALRDGVLDPAPEVFASLHEEAVLQQRIVDDLQDLALAEAGSLVYHRRPVDLAELAEAGRAAHQAVARAAGVGLLVEPGRAVLVDVDADRIRQVLGNLVSNAIRATPPGGDVVIRVRPAGLEVADTGTGIDEEDLPHVFDRFWRADPARGRATGGSGLGLAIVRQIVADHDGSVTVRSSAGAGTTFTVTLPVATGSGGAETT